MTGEPSAPAREWVGEKERGSKNKFELCEDTEKKNKTNVRKFMKTNIRNGRSVDPRSIRSCSGGERAPERRCTKLLKSE